MKKSLSNIRVLDLSRVLAGPFCTQVLGDMGADIIKVEKPLAGDDTRFWGPPFLKDADGNDTTESAYYLSANRNKRSLAVDITSKEGQEIIHKLLEKSDVLIENFKTGGLKKYGLGYQQIKARHPHIVYCSITGFGQTGPMANEPGYDFLAQAMAGLMACTGGPDEEPTKVGVALSDIITGLFAAIGILGALKARDETGKGQQVDLSLLDCTLASLTNIAQYYLTSGNCAPRLGNAHATIVPYQAFEASDGYIILAIGNDGQFARFCEFIGKDWHEDERFATNAVRVENRESLIPLIRDVLAAQTMSYWIESLSNANVPCGPVNTMDQVFDMPQIKAREMQIQMPHSDSDTPINLVGNPLKFSETPVSYDYAPPKCGQHTAEILKNLLEFSSEEVQALDNNKIIQS